MENNDYTMLDMFFPNHRTLNEDTSAGKEAMPAIAPSVSVNNPPDNKIPVDQKKIDKPEEGMPKFKCPKCMSESAETETKGKYKCSKCGQTFSVETIKEDDEKIDRGMETESGLKGILTSMADNWNDYSIKWDGLVGSVMHGPKEDGVYLLGKIKLEEFKK